MAARLGHVLYWIACGLTALWFGAFFVALVNSGKTIDKVELGPMAAVLAGGAFIWLVGLAFRYILAGPKKMPVYSSREDERP